MNMYIDYEKGKVLGSKLEEEAKTLNELFEKIIEIHDKLENNVKDEIDEKYAKPLIENIDTMKEYCKLISSAGQTLTNISSAYIKVEKSCEVKQNEE